MDHWLTLRSLDHQYSLPRTKLIHQLLQQSAVQGVAHSEQRMWQLLAVDPVWDHSTIYATVCIPATDRFVTLVTCPHPPPAKHAARGKQRGKRR